MGRRIHVRGQRKEKPNYHLYVLALIALARQLQEEEEHRAAHAAAVETTAEVSE